MDREPCHHCGRESIRTDRRHWRIHLTTSGKVVAPDYDGDDSQGTFAIGPGCRKRYPLAFRDEPWT